MDILQNEIEKLFKLYNLDENYFILETFKFIEKLFKGYLNKDLEDQFDLYIEEVLLKIDRNNKSIKNYQISVLNQLSVDFNIIQSCQFNCKVIGIKSSDLLLNLYEIVKILNFKNIESYIKKYFKQFSNEFDKIEKLFSDGNQNINIQKNEIDTIDVELKNLGNNIDKINQRISQKTFKNTALKYDVKHLDYQRKYWALSDVQSKIVEEIFSNLSGCFFVEGVAGSGKSMVLLKLFKMINENSSAATSYFLTYTNSLVRFDKNGLQNTKFQSDIIKNIKTVDSYFSYNWKLDFMDFKILREMSSQTDNKILMDLLKKSIEIYNENGGECKITTKEAFDLIEHYIFERLFNKEDCQRFFQSLDLYFISEIYRSLQIEKKVVSRAFSIVCMIEAFKCKGRKGYTDYILVDESQDLTLAQLELLRLSAKKALILAGDANQSIYLTESSLDDLPFCIKHYKLSENYRNTYEVKTLADSYLNSFKSETSIKRVVYEKKTNGLRPRLFKCHDVISTMDLLLRKLKIDIDEFNLDLKDILIICPSNYVIKKIVERIEFPIKYLKDRNVNFNENCIKISTIYSSKGCGFAYIYLMIDNKIYVKNSFSTDEKEKVLKRLIYVSLTRSMNSLNIFIPLSKTPLKPISNLLNLLD